MSRIFQFLQIIAHIARGEVFFLRTLSCKPWLYTSPSCLACFAARTRDAGCTRAPWLLAQLTNWAKVVRSWSSASQECARFFSLECVRLAQCTHARMHFSEGAWVTIRRIEQQRRRPMNHDHCLRRHHTNGQSGARPPLLAFPNALTSVCVWCEENEPRKRRRRPTG